MPKNKRRNRDATKQMANASIGSQNKLNQGDRLANNGEGNLQSPVNNCSDVPLIPVEEKVVPVNDDRKSSLQDSEPSNSSNQDAAETKPEVISKNKESQGSSQRKASPSSSTANNSSKTSSGPTSNSGVAKTGLERSLKDLSRQISSLKRIELRIESEIESSMKRLKKAFQDVRKLLDDREIQLEQEMNKAKEDARRLIAQRQQQAAELKVRVDNVSILEEPAIAELRADIKHFVVERKYDEELGSMTFFMWERDKITDDIQRFAEVIPVKNHYSQRCNSASSSQTNTSVEVTNTNGYKTPEGGTGEATSADHEQNPTSLTTTRPNKRPEGSRPRVFSNRGRYMNATANGPSSQVGYDQSQAGSASYRKDNNGHRWQSNSGHQRQSWSHYNGDYRGGNSRNFSNQDSYGRADRGGRSNRGQNGERYPHRRDSNYSNRGPRGVNNNRVPSNRQSEESAGAVVEDVVVPASTDIAAVEK